MAHFIFYFFLNMLYSSNKQTSWKYNLKEMQYFIPYMDMLTFILKINKTCSLPKGVQTFVYDDVGCGCQEI